MDFKVAGTKDFVTALQLDTKLDGIPSQVLAGALSQAKDARLTILEVMAEAIDAPDEMSPYAPRITTIKVPVDKIGEVIGPKGKMINSITEETGAQISIEDDGTVFVGATDGPSAQAAIDKINAIANPQLPKIGERFLGTVVKTTDFGAFVSLLPGRDGLVHISKLGRGKRIAKVEDVVKVGDKLRVEIADIDNRGKISLILVAEEDSRTRHQPTPAPCAGRCRDRQQLRSGGHCVAAPRSATKRRQRVRRTTLPGGLRVVTEYIPSVHSASVGVWVGVGSRDEGRSVAGAAHFLEHLLFKSTPTRTAVEIAQAVDAVGGELNAFTAREHTCYYAHVLDTDLELAVDLVADVVLRGRCAADDVELERDVVLEEIAMRDDDPEDTLGDVFLSAMFGEHPVGRPVIGSVESVSAMTRAQLHSFHLRRYTPERMVVAVAGNVEHDEVVALVREHFGSRLVRGRSPVAPRKGTGRVTGRPTLQLVNRDAEQTHLSIGCAHPRQALGASVGAVGAQHRVGRRPEFASVPTDSGNARLGVLGVLDGGHLLRQRGAVDLRRVPARTVRRSGPGDHRRARDRWPATASPKPNAESPRARLRGGLVLGLEDSGSRMNRIGRSELNYGEHRSIAHTLGKIDDVTLDEVNAVAHQLLTRPTAPPSWAHSDRKSLCRSRFGASRADRLTWCR